MRAQNGKFVPGFRLISIATRVRNWRVGGGIGTGSLQPCDEAGEESAASADVRDGEECENGGSEFLQQDAGGYASPNPIIALVKGMCGGRDRLIENPKYRVINDYEIFDKVASRKHASQMGWLEEEGMEEVRVKMREEVLDTGILQYDLNLADILHVKPPEVTGAEYRYASGESVEENGYGKLLLALGIERQSVWYRKDRAEKAGVSALQQVIADHRIVLALLCPVNVS